MAIILASQSPIRKELLSMVVSEFETMPADIDETVKEGIAPLDYVLEMAQQKAECIAKYHPDDLVIGSDTTVVVDGMILGKPVDKADAKAMLTRLSGTTHHVHTAVCMMIGSDSKSEIITTEVTFFDLMESEIEEYVASGDPMDKAGAYGIQGPGTLFVKAIQGDFYGVVGFPIAHVKRMLSEF